MAYWRVCQQCIVGYLSRTRCSLKGSKEVKAVSRGRRRDQDLRYQSRVWICTVDNKEMHEGIDNGGAKMPGNEGLKVNIWLTNPFLYIHVFSSELHHSLVRTG